MAQSAEDISFQRKLVLRLAEEARLYAYPKIPSNHLKNRMQVYATEPNKAFVEIPDYWAVYLHDGRGAFGPKSAKVIVYFRDPNQDPRLNQGHGPVRYADRKRMTGAQFSFWLRQNRIARSLGAPPPMIVRTFVGPQVGSFFFDNNRGMAGFADRADEVAAPIALDYIRSQLAEHLQMRVADAAVVFLGL